MASPLDNIFGTTTAKPPAVKAPISSSPLSNIFGSTPTTKAAPVAKDPIVSSLVQNTPAPAPTEGFFSKSLKALKSGFSKASEYVAGAAEAPVYTNNSWSQTFRNLPNEIVRTILPNAAALNDDPELASQVSNTDIAKEVPGLLFENFVAPLASFAQTFYGATNTVLDKIGFDTVGGTKDDPGNVSWHIPGLGKVTNMQARIADDIAHNGVPDSALGTSIKVASYTGKELLNGLYAASLVSGLVNPRMVNIADINAEQSAQLGKSNTLGTGKSTGPKSFQLYQQPTIVTPQFTKLSPEFLDKLKDVGIDVSKYSEANPTFFKFQLEGNGQITGKIIAVKPSYLDSFANVFKGDITKVPTTGLTTLYEKSVPLSEVAKTPKPKSDPFASLVENLKSSGHDADRFIESGDAPVENFYKNAAGELQPQQVEHTVSDLAGKMDMFQKGLGAKFKAAVDISNPTPTNLENQAIEFVEKLHPGPTSFPHVLPLPNGTTRPIIVHPAVAEETRDHIATHGEDITHQELQDKLGATPRQASNIIKAVKQNPEKSAEDILKTIMPAATEETVTGLENIFEKDSLLDEARKYKNAEDFIKAQGDPLYHGTTQESALSIEKEGFKKPSQLPNIETPTIKNTAKLGDHVFFTVNKDHANTFANVVAKDGQVLDVYAKDLKLARIEEAKGNDLTEKLADLKSRGFDGSITGSKGSRMEEIAVWNLDKIKTRSQLTDIYNKSVTNKKAPPEVIAQHVDYHNYAIEELKTQIEEHPGRIAQRFMSRKEGQFEDFQNPDYAKTPAEKRRIEVRNAKAMRAIENAVSGTKYEGQFDNVDAIREAIEEYRNMQDSLQSHKEALAEAKKGNIPRNAQGGFIAPGAIFKDLSSPVTKFLKEDVIPTTGDALSGFKNTMKGMVNVLVPTVGVKPADLDLVMRMKGARDKQEYIFAKTHEIIKNNFSKMTRDEQVNFVDRMKRGEPQPNPGLQAVANGLRIIDTAMWNAVKAYKPSLNWKENHFRVLWKVVPGSPQAFGFKGLFNKPLQGTKGFTKQSTLLDMSEGLAKGGVPISYNPIELFTYAYADMNKYLTAQEMIKAFKEQGQMVFVKKGKFPAEGYVRLNDTIAKVYMPVEMKNGKVIVTPSGEWYIEENVGRLLNNYLSKDYIRSSDIGRGMLAVKNAYTAIELSASPFHAVFESLETMGSSIGLGLRQAINTGNFLKGAKTIAGSPISPYTTAKLGKDAIKFLTGGNTAKEMFFRQEFIKKYPDIGNLLTDLFNGGGRMKMDDTYQVSTEKVFTQNLKNGNYIGATLRALPALSKTLTKPLFEIYIPQLKVGTFLKEYSQSLVENSKELALGKTTREKLARETWNFVEDRFGEMNFDNLFWNKTFKTSMQLLFRSVTWKMGNLRATGGSMAGQGQELYLAAKQRRAPKLHPKFAWLLGMSIITALIGTIAMEIFAKKKPIGIKDIIYPQIDDKGNRISTPTYWKDAYHLQHDPVGYIRSSMSGMIGKVTDVWQNKDFYGVEVHNPNDSFFKRAIDNMVHILPVPFSVSSMIAFKNSNAPLSKQLLGFFGFTKAPGYINQNEIQQKIFDLFSTRLGGGVISQEDADVKNQKAEIRKAYQNGDPDKANELLKQAVKDGVVKDVDSFIEKADLPGDIRAFAALPSSDQRNLISNMSLDEISKYAWYVHSDVQDSFSDLSANANEFVDQFKAGTITQPQYKRGAPVDDGTKPVYNAGDQSSDTGIISRVVAYAQAIGTDPSTAFHDIFHGQIIRKINNGTIIVDRMSLEDSTAIKKKGNANNPTMKLDHTLPLELGGTNEEDNLKLVTTEEWASYTPVENYLSKALTKKVIDKKTDQDLIRRFKNKEITFDDIQRQVKE